MKKVLLVLTVISLFGFAASGDSGMKLKVTKITPLDATRYNVALELCNGLDRKVSFLGMYCSNSGFYVTDNPNVLVIPKPCGKNFPIAVPIARNSCRPSTIELQLKNAKQATFRIGFKFIEIPKGIEAIGFDSTAVKSNTVWSNTIEFKTR